MGKLLDRMKELIAGTVSGDRRRASRIIGRSSAREIEEAASTRRGEVASTPSSGPRPETSQLAAAQPRMPDPEARPDHTRRDADARSPRREHNLHQLGFALIWLSTVGIAFTFGYSVNHPLTRIAALIVVWCTIVVLIAGIRLFTKNRHRRDQRS